MFCPNCGTKNTEHARFCIQCGHSYTNKQKKSKWLFTSMLIIVLLMSGGLIYHFVLNNTRTEEISGKEEIQTQTDVEANAPQSEEQTVAKKDIEKETTTVDKEEKNSTVQKAPPVKPSTQKDKKDIIRDAQTKVFTILTTNGQGSGFLFQDNGTIVTNAHVVAGFVHVIVRDQNGREMNGQVIGISNQYDVALIKTDTLAGTPPLELEMQESEVGTEVIALGSPRGLENTASIGYLTGLDRSFVTEFQYENVYQIDAQVSPGSSGGPLLDGKTGKVIGINSALLTSDTSIAFSIPMYTMTELLESWSRSPMNESQVANTFYFYNEFDTYEEYEYDNEGENRTIVFDEESLSNFIVNFRASYEVALQYEDFSFIQDFLLYDSEAYYELADYLDEITGKGMAFNFTSNQVTNIDSQSDRAIVSTFETFDFMNAAGEWSVYERMKDYTVVTDEYGNYRIAHIEIYQ